MPRAAQDDPVARPRLGDRRREQLARSQSYPRQGERTSLGRCRPALLGGVLPGPIDPERSGQPCRLSKGLAPLQISSFMSYFAVIHRARLFDLAQLRAKLKQPAPPNRRFSEL